MHFPPVRVLLLLLAAAGTAQAETASMPELPALNTLVQRTMASFAYAVKNDDMASLLATSSAPFKSQMSSEKLHNNFLPFIDKKIDLTEVSKVVPVLSLPPAIDKDGILTLQGNFPAKPQTWYYRFRYVYEYPDWKPLGYNVTSDLE